jgi:hypothetical protein
MQPAPEQVPEQAPASTPNPPPAPESVPQNPPQPPITNEERKKNKKKAVFWLIAPISTLFIVIVLWAVVAYIAARLLSVGTGAGITTILQLVNIVLGFVGLVSILAIPTGIVLGIYYLMKKS